MQRTNKHKRCWKRKVGARVQKKKILGLPGEDDTEMFLRFYSRAGVAASTPGAAFACSVIAGRHGDWWVSRIEQRNKQDTGRERVEREWGKKEREEIREEEERQRARQRARERENRRARFLAIAFWRRSDDGLYTAEGPSSSPPPPPTYSDVRVLENYYLNKYIHGGKFKTSFLKIFFLN